MLWFKMHADFYHCPKVQSMSEAMQRRLIMLFCLKCSGELDTLSDDEVRFALRVPRKQWATTKALFIGKGFVDDALNLLNWDKRQFSTEGRKERGEPMTSTERSRLCRERKRNGNATGATACNDPATDATDATKGEKGALHWSKNDQTNSLENQQVIDATATPLDTDTETDAEIDTDKNKSLKAYAPEDGRAAGSAAAPPRAVFSSLSNPPDEPSDPFNENDDPFSEPTTLLPEQSSSSLPEKPLPAQNDPSEENLQNGQNTQIDAKPSNSQNLAYESIQATLASENDLNRQNEENRPLSEGVKAARTKHVRKNASQAAKPEEVAQEVWDDFLKLRHSKKAPLTPTAISQIKNEAQKANLPLNEVLAHCCARGWQGFRAKWILDNVRELKSATPAIPQPDNVESQVWQDYLLLRERKNAPLTLTALQALNEESAKANIALNDALKIAIQRGWTGISAEWLMQNDPDNGVKRAVQMQIEKEKLLEKEREKANYYKRMHGL